MSEVVKVPKLRFPEFNECWNGEKLKNISTFINGRAYKQTELLNIGKYPVLRVGNFFTNNQWYFSDLELNEDKYCDNGDLLYAWSASFGPKIWQGKKVIYHYHIWKVVNNQGKITKNYLYYVLDNETLKMKSQSANGFALLHITKGTIENWSVNIPSLQEQKKIASFLSSVDKKINLLEQKKDLLELYKKGVMQQIFSQHIRFKDDDGNNYPDWEEKKLEKVSDINPRNKEFPESFVYIDLESVTNGVLVKQQKIKTSEAPSRAQRLLIKNDILFQTVRPYQMNNLYFDKEDENFVASTGYAQIRTQESPKFLYYVLHTHDFVKKVLLRCTGTSYPAINSKDLGKIFIELPVLEEQIKIANFLSAIDNKIQLVEKQLEHTQYFKKGLLQQMFI